MMNQQLLKCKDHHSHVKMGNGAFLLLKGTSKSNHVATLRKRRSIILLRFSVPLGLISFSLYIILDFYITVFVRISAQSSAMIVPLCF